LEIHDANASDKWKKFFHAWSSYVIATELHKKAEAVQAATLLTVIGSEITHINSKTCMQFTTTHNIATAIFKKISLVLFFSSLATNLTIHMLCLLPSGYTQLQLLHKHVNVIIAILRRSHIYLQAKFHVGRVENSDTYLLFSGSNIISFLTVSRQS